jgi:hypothetical protein
MLRYGSSFPVHLSTQLIQLWIIELRPSFELLVQWKADMIKKRRGQLDEINFNLGRGSACKENKER